MNQPMPVATAPMPRALYQWEGGEKAVVDLKDTGTFERLTQRDTLHLVRMKVQENLRAMKGPKGETFEQMFEKYIELTEKPIESMNREERIALRADTNIARQPFESNVEATLRQYGLRLNKLNMDPTRYVDGDAIYGDAMTIEFKKLKGITPGSPDAAQVLPLPAKPMVQGVPKQAERK